jgi:hypothetical protein
MVTTVLQSDGGTGEFGVALSEPLQRIYVPYTSSGNQYIGYYSSATALDDGALSTDQQLMTLSVDASTASGFSDGAAFSVTPTFTASSGATTVTGSTPQIGAYGGGTNWGGSFQEVIIYPTDQSANRVGIETNINDHYGIY